MNKTHTVNIGGVVFHIEEQAYEILRKYLDSIKSHFSTSDGRDEIMQDIESRIGEMLNERVSTSKQVIVSEDVNEIINIMGKPEQFVDDSEKSKSSASDEAFYESIKRNNRRMYRDVDDRVISGVCAGLSHRLGIDPVWLRLIWVFVTIATWSGAFWLYIILAIVLPKAETAAQKLEMKGEAVNIDSLKKQFDTPQSSKSQSSVSRFFDVVGDVFVTIFKAFVYFIGIILAIVCVSIFIALFAVLLAGVGVVGVMPDGLFDLFISPTIQLWSAISLLLVIGIPVFMVLYKIIKWIFKIQTKHQWLRVSALILWIAGLFMSMYSLTQVFKEYAFEQKRRIEIPLNQPAGNTMVLEALKDPDFDWHNNHDFNVFNRKINFQNNKSEFMVPDVKLNIEKAEGTNFELSQAIYSKGNSDRDAYETASKITYRIEQKDSVINFAEYFPLASGDKFRNQRVRMILKVPVGKSVYLGNSIRHILYNVENVTETYDLDMINHTWTMTEAGLKCVDCNFSNDTDSSVNKNSGNANIQIDENGILIESDSDTTNAKDVKIKIDKHGVQIKSKTRTDENGTQTKTWSNN